MTKTITTSIILLLALFTGLFVAPQPAAAQREASGERLERLYERLVFAEEGLQLRLDRSENVIERLEELIGRLNENGTDTSALQGALDQYKTEVEKAKTLAADGKGVLDTGAGFDSEGKVTDMETAAQTLRSAGEAMRDANRTLREGSIAFRDAVRAIRQANQE